MGWTYPIPHTSYPTPSTNAVKNNLPLIPTFIYGNNFWHMEMSENLPVEQDEREKALPASAQKGAAGTGNKKQN